MNQFRTIDDLDVKGKRVLLRTDLNVPIRDGVITDATRIERTLPTIQDLKEKGAQVILLSHFGRPKGRRILEMSLKPISLELEKHLKQKIFFVSDCVGDQAVQAIASADDNMIIMLENLRFHPEEEENDTRFAQQIAALADIYVNDAFSCAHRAHASTEAITRFLPTAAGRLMQSELEALNRALSSPKRPVAALVGGAKISTKMAVLNNLALKVDQIIIGGGMANTFLYSSGVNVGKSLCEVDMAEQAKDILAQASAVGCEIVLPTDAIVAQEFLPDAAHKTVPINAVPTDSMILDVGPRSIGDLIQRLEQCRTIVWNGPLGAFEISPFDHATNTVALAAARLTQERALMSIAGGGDTIAALTNAGAVHHFSYISTAGGAFLEWLEGKTLPGVLALSVKIER